MTPKDECSMKHAKLAFWSIAIIIGLVGALNGYFYSMYGATVNDHDTRLRSQESNTAAMQATMEAVKESLHRIENKLDSRPAAAKP